MTKVLTFDELLEEKGIHDGGDFLAAYDDKAICASIGSPLIELRGSVHLMLDRTIDRDDVIARMGLLRRV